MKYWNNLTQIENEVMRVGEFKNLMMLVANGSETASGQEIQTGLYTLLGMIEDIDEKLSKHFQDLWDSVRHDDGGDDSEEEEISLNIDDSTTSYAWDPVDSNLQYSETISLDGLDINLGSDVVYSATMNDQMSIPTLTTAQIAELTSNSVWSHIVNDLNTYKSNT